MMTAFGARPDRWPESNAGFEQGGWAKVFDPGVGRWVILDFMSEPKDTNSPRASDTAAQLGRPEYWAGVWQHLHHRSLISAHQKSQPGAWLDFFNRVAEVYLPMQGDPWAQGQAVTNFLMAQGVVTPQDTLLDLGAGPGSLAVPLAERGVRVTAVDLAKGVTAVMAAEAARRGLTNLDIRHLDWLEFETPTRFDQVLAAFFAPALSPDGLARMEAWAGKYCVLALSTGRPSFPFREVLAAELEDFPPPKDSRDLACAFNYLLASGRQPNLQHLSWPMEFRQPLDTVVHFYREYYALYGRNRPEDEAAVRRVLSRFVVDGLVQSRGRASLALLWWQPGGPEDPATGRN